MDYALIGLVLAAMAFWLAFVPRSLRFDDKDLEVRFHFRPARRLPWRELRFWRKRAGLLRLRFGAARVTIFVAAFPRARVRQLEQRMMREAKPG